MNNFTTMVNDKIKKYYEDFFKEFKETDLFEVYDMEREKFIQFIGREGSEVVNKKTLMDNLIMLTVYQENGDSLIVMRYDRKKDLQFIDPIFIGRRDYYWRNV